MLIKGPLEVRVKGFKFQSFEIQIFTSHLQPFLLFISKFCKCGVFFVLFCFVLVLYHKYCECSYAIPGVYHQFSYSFCTGQDLSNFWSDL